MTRRTPQYDDATNPAVRWRDKPRNTVTWRTPQYGDATNPAIRWRDEPRNTVTRRTPQYGDATNLAIRWRDELAIRRRQCITQTTATNAQLRTKTYEPATLRWYHDERNLLTETPYSTAMWRQLRNTTTAINPHTASTTHLQYDVPQRDGAKLACTNVSRQSMLIYDNHPR